MNSSFRKEFIFIVVFFLCWACRTECMSLVNYLSFFSSSSVFLGSFYFFLSIHFVRSFVKIMIIVLSSLHKIALSYHLGNYPENYGRRCNMQMLSITYVNANCYFRVPTIIICLRDVIRTSWKELRVYKCSFLTAHNTWNTADETAVPSLNATQSPLQEGKSITCLQ